MLKDYNEKYTPQTKDPKSFNWWKNRPKYIISFLKAMYGANATPENDFGYTWLPKLDDTQNASWLMLFDQMAKGKFKGFFAWGQNPACSGANAGKVRKAMENLDWMVNVNLFDNETGSFWKGPGKDPSKIKTEVFMLPCAASFEKEGSISNSGRWMQWRYKAAVGPGEAEDDLWMINRIMLKLKEFYTKEGSPNADAIINMVWNYGDPPDVHKVAKEVNGYDVATGKQIDGFANLKDDGTTACGEWVYCGSYVEPDKEPTAPVPGNRASRRDLTPDVFNIGLYPKWAWSWPVNRRIIYNRASVDLNGEPWDKEHPVIKWNPTKGGTGGWDGDIVDGNYPPLAVDPAKARLPFIMTFEGVARLFGQGMTDGPMPEFYEPWETPVTNQMSEQQNNPVFKIWRPTEKGTADRFPIVASTYRVVEHWQAGQMTRNLPWVVEMMPEPFVEMSEELAAEKGIKNGEKVIVESARGQVNMVAVVTKRFKPFQMNGRKVHQVGMVWHWGYTGLSTGDSANLLTPHVGDANTMIPEYKAFLVNVRKA
jgi:formate dehydrogenase major subunit